MTNLVRSELRKADARAVIVGPQRADVVENGGSTPHQRYGPPKTLTRMVCGRLVQMFNCCFGIIAGVFAVHDCATAIESRASEPSALRSNPATAKQPHREIIDGPRREPAIMPANVTNESALSAVSTLFPPEDAGSVTVPTPERTLHVSAGKPGRSTTGSRSPRRSIQKVSATARRSQRNNDGPALPMAGNRHLILSADPNPRTLLTFKPTKDALE
jgi:hypothetical protein